MRVAAAGLACLTAALAAGAARAGPWAQPQGQGQVIFKYEDMVARRGFDADGRLADLPAERREGSLGVFAEYGLSDRLTLQIKGDWQQGEDAFVDYDGRGPLEIGVTWQVWRDAKSAISLYGGYADAGEGRNAGYAAPGVGDHDWEARLSVGRSMANGRGFVDLQAARRIRDGLPDEARADATVGVHLNKDWMVLGQMFGGVADDSGPRWLNVETSVVRRLGSLSVQAGWRQTVAGRETPAAGGVILALWRRF
ncbi:hypothetical protein [uncultured Brevundimonas sp.]|uniref:hypothetical protein n=1 Tax=uncultured Brevundimonas sp. TaxID=213418 RepID=UPI0030ECB179